MRSTTVDGSELRQRSAPDTAERSCPTIKAQLRDAVEALPRRLSEGRPTIQHRRANINAGRLHGGPLPTLPHNAFQLSTEYNPLRPDVRLESAFGGRPEVEFRGRQVR